jgi:hypothetical protein
MWPYTWLSRRIRLGAKADHSFFELTIAGFQGVSSSLMGARAVCATFCCANCSLEAMTPDSLRGVNALRRNIGSKEPVETKWSLCDAEIEPLCPWPRTRH